MRTYFIVASAMLAGFTLCSPARASEEDIYGTWKLVSEQIKYLDTGEIIDTAARGYVTYGKDGRMIVLLVRGARPKPDSVATMTDQQRLLYLDR